MYFSIVLLKRLEPMTNPGPQALLASKLWPHILFPFSETRALEKWLTPGLEQTMNKMNLRASSEGKTGGYLGVTSNGPQGQF